LNQVLSRRSILQNAEDYPEPQKFNPDRYLTPDGQLDPSVRDPATAAFGFGRRICPGRFFADASLCMTIATLLATVDVVRATDAQGNAITPKVAVKDAFTSLPEPFPWAVRERSRVAQELLERAAEQ
jgi:cytochrome P450